MEQGLSRDGFFEEGEKVRLIPRRGQLLPKAQGVQQGEPHLLEIQAAERTLIIMNSYRHRRFECSESIASSCQRHYYYLDGFDPIARAGQDHTILPEPANQKGRRRPALAADAGRGATQQSQAPGLAITFQK